MIFSINTYTVRSIAIDQWTSYKIAQVPNYRVIEAETTWESSDLKIWFLPIVEFVGSVSLQQIFSTDDVAEWEKGVPNRFNSSFEVVVAILGR